MLNGKTKERVVIFNNNMEEEKEYIINFYGGNIVQLDKAEYLTYCAGMDDRAKYVVLKDGRRLSTGGFQSVGPNPHYVSQESIDRMRKKRTYWEEYQFLKNEGQLTTPEEYIEWKKKSNANMKKFEEYIKEGDENEEKRIT